MALCVCEKRHRPVADGRMAPLCDVCQARHDLYEAQAGMRAVEAVEREDPCPNCQGTGASSLERYEPGTKRPYLLATEICPVCKGSKRPAAPADTEPDFGSRQAG